MARSRRISVEIIGDNRSLERTFQRSAHSAGVWNSEIIRASRGALAATVGFSGLGRAVAFASGSFIGVAGLATGLRESISAMSQFQDTMQKTVGLSGVAQSQVAGLSKEVLKLAPAVGIGPQELAKALYFITSSGIDASHAMGVLEASAKAAVAGLGDTTTVADAVTSAINAYGQANITATHATDVLVAAVRQGKGEADALSGSIGSVSALAAQMGVSFNDVGAALAAETRLGIDAETAAINLQQVFTNMLKVTPQSAKAFKSVGLSAAGLRKTFADKGLLAGLLQIKKAFGDNTVALANAFPNIRALRGILALVGKQSAETSKIFRTMADTTGSLKTAFDAVSKDTAQKFRQLRASAEVTGIAVGAMFAPLAGAVADALRKASGEFTNFVGKIQRQHTIQGKLNVIWTGVASATKGATVALANAVKAVNWAQVWAGARGIADGLQARLEAVDWGKVGKAIGDGIASAVQQAIPAAKDIATRIGAAVRTIDWNQLGRALGPGLAAALVSAFATLTDPAFWIKNWDLALAIGLTAFGGAIGKFAGKVAGRFAAPLARLGGDLVLRISEAVSRFAPRIGEALLAGMLALPRLVGRALAPLADVVSRAFAKLGRLARFTIKVLGIQAAINAVTNAFAHLAHVISGALDDAFQALKRKAIETALAIVEPFSHLPGWLGGGPFRKIKSALQSELDGMKAAAKQTADAIANSMTGAARAVEDSAKAAAGIARRPIPIPKQKQAPRPKLDTATSAAATAAATTEKSFELSIALQLRLAKAAVTKSTRDDISAMRAVQKFVRAAIDSGKLTRKQLVQAWQQLGQVNTDLANTIKQAQEAVVQARSARQFRSLGLTAAGDEPIPGVKALKKQLSRIGDVVKGTFLDTDKTRSLLARIRKVLSGGLGAVTRDVRAKIAELLKGIDDQLKQHAGAQTKFAHVSSAAFVKALGLDLTPDQIRRLRSGVSQLGAGATLPSIRAQSFALAGGGPVVVHTTVNLDGREVAKNTTQHQQHMQKQRGGVARRGPFAGRG